MHSSFRVLDRLVKFLLTRQQHGDLCMQGYPVGVTFQSSFITVDGAVQISGGGQNFADFKVCTSGIDTNPALKLFQRLLLLVQLQVEDSQADSIFGGVRSQIDSALNFG